MARLQKEVQAVCVCLDEVGALPEETAIDIMSGLTHCSMPEFTKLLIFSCRMLEQWRWILMMSLKVIP